MATHVLHIVATPRNHQSSTLKVSNAIIDGLCAKHPDTTIETIDLFNSDVPAMAGDRIEAKYHLLAGGQMSKALTGSWAVLEEEIVRFLAADLYVLSVPMWNLTIPYALKFYIDTIVQPGYLFKYTPEGVPVGLATGKRMICVTSRGGDYSTPDGSNHPYDFMKPYLSAIFGFCGITDIQYLDIQPMDITPEIREAKVQEALSVRVPALLEKY